ncbi:carbohydrate porin [Candidatus Babeliales bacterium]|nr:carbohydrate porin [Candidatus Babeliales bacterium]
MHLRSAVGRHQLSPLGVGLFFRVGWAPKNQNIIDQFYSIGFGGFGVSGRIDDRWGIGYAMTYVSKNLRNDLITLDNNDLHASEHAIEAFYNLQVAPSIHTTLHMQAITSPLTTQSIAFPMSVTHTGRFFLDKQCNCYFLQHVEHVLFLELCFVHNPQHFSQFLLHVLVPEQHMLHALLHFGQHFLQIIFFSS